MKKIIHILYIIYFIFFLALAGYLLVTFDNNKTEIRQDDGYQILTQYQSAWEEDASLPCGGKDTIRIDLDEIPVVNSCIAFCSVHQEINVYINGELIYQQRASEQNLFGKTPGNLWNSVPIYQEDCGKEIIIELIPVYESSIGNLPEIYLGSKLDICRYLIQKDIPGMIMGVLAVVFGVIFCIYSVYNYRNPQTDKSLLMLGFFSLHIGAWEIADLETASLLFPFQPALAYFPLFSLSLALIPFALFIKKLFTKKEGLIWDIYCLLCAGGILMSIIFQLTGYRDFRQTLWIAHIMMFALASIFICKMVRELRKNGWSSWLKVTAVFMTLCLLGMTIDICLFYLSSHSSTRVLGMLGFVSYIITLGIMKMRENQRLLAMGIKAKQLEKVAYHDPLTGLYNRAAYVEDIGKESFNPKDYIVAMFDLNNLKQCNDTLGHEAGDRYLIESAGMLHQTFGNIGKCYRMGGDEFCVLMEGRTLEECRIRTAELQNMVEKRNKQCPGEFVMQIACGYKKYCADIDYDIGDTLRRADKMMYHEKLMMKLIKDQ